MRHFRSHCIPRLTAAGYTLIEAFFVLVAVVVISFILIGLYLKHTRPPAPDTPPQPPATAR
jgi:hypothetical protein